MPLSTPELLRYNRQMLMPEFGQAGQEKLKAAKILVVGCGGLGCPALLYLAAAGVGKLGIVDADRVDLSNLQRQILYATATIGNLKVDEAQHRISALNPLVEVQKYALKICAQNALEIIEPYDIVIDGSDNFPTRYLLNDACVLLNKPLVYGAVHRFEGQVSVFNYQNQANYRDLFPQPPPPEMAPNCAEAGVLGVLPGIIGTLQATEALKIMSGVGQVLAGKLLLFDALSMTFRSVRIQANPDAPAIRELIDYEHFCGLNPTSTIPEISAAELTEWIERGTDFQLIDVRNANEYARQNLGGTLLPLPDIENWHARISRHRPVVVHCQSGARSVRAVQILSQQHGFTNLINLKHGLFDFNDATSLPVFQGQPV